MKAYRRPPPPPPRPREAHKASVGRVLVVGGSRDLAGAPFLAAWGALHAGAGLVRAAVPREIQPVVAGFAPEVLTAGLAASRAGGLARAASSRVRALAAAVDAVVVGPGAGREAGTSALLRELALGLAVPVVVDADALFAFQDRTARLASRKGTAVLTPHEGEAARLLGSDAEAVRADRRAAALALQRLSGQIVVLKGPGTLVADGERLYRCPHGGPVLASGGTGDVLAGMVAALVAAGGDPFEATCQAVAWHARTADRLAALCGADCGLTASGLAESLPPALAAWRAERQR